jgi:glycosyltransferase involved in cell wall biosynthesis
MNVKLSIVIPCYNSEKTLESTLESVYKQDFQEWEAIIVNDGSTDGTDEIANRWINIDNRFSYYCKSNEGLSKTRNFAISKAKGIYILPLDSDNQLIADYSKSAIEIFENHEGIGVVYGDALYFGQKSGIWKVQNFNFKKMLVDNYIDACAVYKKSTWEIVGGYDENILFQKGLEDWDFWISIGKLDLKFYHLQKITFRYYVNRSSMIKSLSNQSADEIREYMLEKHSKEYRYHFSSLYAENEYYKGKLKNKKYVINAFCKLFFGFNVFKANDKLENV